MKSSGMVAFVFAAVVSVLSISSAESAKLGDAMSPVTRVVELLRSLEAKIAEEADNEESLFKAFACWSNTIVTEKTDANEKAQSRIDELERYVADLDAGRIELTSERVDLENEVERLTTEMEVAQNLRDKENKDYLAAKGELVTGIDALKDAIQVLKDAREPTFLAVDHEERHERANSGQGLALVLELASESLTKGDAIFLQGLLSGQVRDVPAWDWKKLDKKATFKEKYTTRTQKIEALLESLKFQFTNGLQETNHKEKEAVKFHDALMKSKGSLKSKANTALGKMDLEGAARGLSKGDATAEIKALKENIVSDKGYITAAKKALSDKKKEHDERKRLRIGESEAINKAIAILYNDDARDLFAKSYNSQGYSLSQVNHRRATTLSKTVVIANHGPSRGMAERRAAAAAAIAAASTADSQLMQLVARISDETGGHFDKVLTAIDKMITNLKAEETTDLTDKEKCEQDRMDDTREVITLARAMDELTDTITRLQSEIEVLEKEIEDKEEEVKQLKKDKADATKVRKDENDAWVIADKDDKDAAEIVGKAVDVLKAYYKAENLAFLAQRQEPLTTAGEAPPPPPATWEKPYGGKTMEKEGIVAILELLQDDIVKDRSTAKKAEDESLKLYDLFIKDCDKQIADLGKEITRLKGVVSKKEGEVTTAKSDRSGKQGELKAAMKKLKDAEPSCDFTTINYAMRVQNRQIEIDGLLKAKAILKGGNFDRPDPNREVKPGDAFVQRKLVK